MEEGKALSVSLINVFGVTTAKQTTTAWMDDDHETYDVAVGVCVVRWSMRSKKRLFFKQLHNDSISFLSWAVIDNRGYALSTSFGGEFSIWDREYNNISSTIIQPGVAIMNLSWSVDNTKFCLSSYNRNRDRLIEQPANEGTVTIWKFDSVTQKPYLLFRKENCFEAWTSWSHDHKAILFNHEHKYIKKEEKGPDSEYLKITKIYARKLSIDGTEEKLIEIPGTDITVLTSTPSGTRFLLGQTNYSVSMFNDSLELLWHYQFDKEFISGALILPNYNTKPVHPNYNDGIIIGTRKRISLFLPNPSGFECVETIKNISEPYLIHLGETKTGERYLWFFCPFSVYRIKLSEEDMKNQIHGNLHERIQESMIGSHDITCCGLAMDEKGEHIASGDFTGNVCIWNFNNQKNEDFHLPILIHKAESMIRSISWRHNEADNEVYFGCMDGTIWKWQTNNPEKPTLICTVPDSATCLAWMNGRAASYLAISDTKGYLTVLKENPDLKFEQILSFKGHGIEVPQQMEIWSIAWSPNNNYIATAGEDRTTHIYKFLPNDNPQLMATLKGPNAAVTCIDWHTTTVGDILVLSSDDRTVHSWVLKDSEWVLYNKFLTKNSHLMITYCAIEPHGNKLAAVTMLGHLYVWDLVTFKNILSHKLHPGSIEGLRWHPSKKMLCTVSSDCTVQVFKFL